MNFLEASIIEPMWRKEQTVTSHRPGHWRRGRIYWKKESCYIYWAWLNVRHCVCLSDSLSNLNIKTLRDRFSCFLKKKKKTLGMSSIFPNCEKLLYLVLSANVLHFRGLLRTMEKHLAPELGGWMSQWCWHYSFKLDAKRN